MRPPVRMDSASSSSLFWSNVWRGLVGDSKSWSMAMYWNSLLFCIDLPPSSAHNRVRFSYSGVRAEHVEEQAHGGADDRCAEAGGGRPEGRGRGAGVWCIEAHHLWLEGEVGWDGCDGGSGSRAAAG